VLGAGTVLGSIVWVAPSVTTVRVVAAAGSPPPPTTTTTPTTTPSRTSVFLLLDVDAIDNTADTTDTSATPAQFTDTDVNDDIASETQRSVLEFFAKPENFGTELNLYSGEVGDEGWFALEAIRPDWVTAGPTSDGLQNFLLATAGGFGGSQTLLSETPDVVPLRAEGLFGLVGMTVGALVHDSDISINYGRPTPSGQDGNLQGQYLGLVAFEVLSVTQLLGESSSSLPVVRIRVVDPATVFGGTLTLYDAPTLTSSSDPFDVVPNGTG
jgi:hypothetical protein